MIVQYETKINLHLIGISGIAGSGKDSVAWNFAELGMFDIPVYRASFAEPIKTILQSIFGFTDRQLTDRQLKETIDPFWDMTPRKFMQLMGTEAARKGIREDIWLKVAERKLQTIANGIASSRPAIEAAELSAYVLFTDCRFTNEAEWIKRHGGAVIQLIRPDQQIIAESNHASEAGLPQELIDYVVENVGDASTGPRNAAAKLYNWAGTYFKVPTKL